MPTMTVKGRRLLISLSPEEEKEVARAARLEALPLATYIRRAAILSARARLAKDR